MSVSSRIPVASSSHNLSVRTASNFFAVIQTRTIPGKNDVYGYGEGNTYQFAGADFYDALGNKLNNNTVTKSIIDIGDDWCLGSQNSNDNVDYTVWKIPSFELDTDPIAKFTLHRDFIYISPSGPTRDTVAFYRQTRDENSKKITQIRVVKIYDGTVEEFTVNGETGAAYQYYHPYVTFMFKDQAFGCSAYKLFDVSANKARSGESQGGTFYNDIQTNGQVVVFRTNSNSKLVVEDIAGKKIGQIAVNSYSYAIMNNVIAVWNGSPNFKVIYFSAADTKELKSVTLTDKGLNFKDDLRLPPIQGNFIVADTNEISLLPGDQYLPPDSAK